MWTDREMFAHLLASTHKSLRHEQRLLVFLRLVVGSFLFGPGSRFLLLHLVLRGVHWTDLEVRTHGRPSACESRGRVEELLLLVASHAVTA
ncbi:hypothetical protein PHMEG_0005776 [Phytophthora megakarya]|uniref:Uncharacterized protein n=1 Tax=Phytophthora megakarya TaxID=4795 RepID=A0A225WQL3_9STRA|nr:hypothetical protein PHMEG_0005776 [Phytophthora megakarya]